MDEKFGNSPENQTDKSANEELAVQIWERAQGSDEQIQRFIKMYILDQVKESGQEFLDKVENDYHLLALGKESGLLRDQFSFYNFKELYEIMFNKKAEPLTKEDA